ncbi:unnamed protein product [Adineta steineri]|uniref:Nose resistant-to-fluoxetine protein N-terminal domain-containing protein n=1 Tax=Adineta steineri TaxID=433720 RepID=A0A815J499_9BILA|nr:unnamed protein product [Adineta steineri]CAF1604268.1 unnamed protein product [Adineta steineri]
MLFSSYTIVVFTFVCIVVGKSNENYSPVPLRLDQAIAQIQLTQKFPSQNLNFNFNENLFSSNAWAINANINNSSQCSQEFEALLNGTLQQEMWAMKFVDAWGKPLPSGVLTGNTYWVGNYDECLNPLYQVADKSFLQQPFDSQYCAFSPQSGEGGSHAVNLVIGLCFPKSCSKQEIAMIVNKVQPQSNFTDKNFVCSTERRPFSAGPVITVIVLTLLCSLLLVGTVVDLVLAHNIDCVSSISARTCHKNQVFELASSSSTTSQSHLSLTKQTPINETIHSSRVPFLVEFSIIRTLQKIFSVPKTEDKANYTFLNGMRVLALIWIILGHSLLYGRASSNNTLEVLSWTKSFAFVFVTNSSFSVDTFFTLSGFLTAILFIRQVEKNTSKGEPEFSVHTFIMYYLHRYLRLTPAFMLVVLVSFNLTPYFGRGPFFPSIHGFEPNGCSQYWWTNMLYLNNLIKPQEMCLGVSWYLANDMQFHWIAPLALVPFALKRKRIAFLVVSLFILISVISTAAILIANPKMSGSAGGLSVKIIKGSYFQPPIDTHLIGTLINIPSVKKFAFICERHNICRTADYNITTKTCRLFETVTSAGAFVADLTTNILPFNYCTDDQQIEPYYVCTRTNTFTMQQIFDQLALASNIILPSTDRGAYANMYGVYTSNSTGGLSFFTYTGIRNNLIQLQGEISNINSATNNGLGIVQYFNNSSSIYKNIGTSYQPQLVSILNISSLVLPYSCLITSHLISNRPVVSYWNDAVIVFDQYMAMEYTLNGTYKGNLPYFNGTAIFARHCIQHDYAGRRHMCNGNDYGLFPGIYTFLMNGTQLAHGPTSCYRGLQVYITKDQAILTNILITGAAIMNIINF